MSDLGWRYVLQGGGLALLLRSDSIAWDPIEYNNVYHPSEVLLR